MTTIKTALSFNFYWVIRIFWHERVHLQNIHTVHFQWFYIHGYFLTETPSLGFLKHKRWLLDERIKVQ